MARIKKWTPVLIEWDDITTVYEPQMSDDLMDMSARRRTVGFFLRRNRREVIICMEDDRGMESDTHDCQTVTRIKKSDILRGPIPLTEVNPCLTNSNASS